MKSGDKPIKYPIENSMTSISMCLVCSWKVGLLTRKIAAWLSQYMAQHLILENQASEEMNVPKTSKRKYAS